MEHLKAIKEQLITQIQGQMADLRCVDTHELGEVIDMVKDIAQAEYYCEIYKQMKEHGAEEPGTNNNYYYTERYYPAPDYYRDMDRYYGRMYYPEGGNSSGGNTSSSSQGGNSNSSSSGNGMNYYSEPYRSRPRSEEFYEKEFPMQYLRDEREGRSPMKRKMYMESKATGQDTSKAMKELENYMQDLTSDMMELLDKASPEEKAMVQKKVNVLASKIQNV